MRINNNIMALNAHRQLAINQSNASKSMEKLSSGFRINRAADDAAGLSISEKMRSQIRGLKQAARNAQDGISLIQTAEGALNETHAILQRMRELVVQAGSVGTNQPEDLTAIQDEINELIAEINGISERTAFNGKTLLDGSLTGDGVLTFQIGANQKQAMTLEIGDMSAAGLGIGGAQTLTPGTAEVAGVANSEVLMDADGKIVAVKASDDKWYAVDDVEENSGDLVAKTGATELEVTEGKTIGGEGFYTEGTAEVAGVANSEVLMDADGKIVAVKASDDKWYAVDDVEENSGDLVAKTGATELTVADAAVLGDGSDAGSAINVAEFKTSEDFDKAVGLIDTAIGLVSSQRSKLGANQNRLEHTISNLNNAQENLQAAESRIRDLDMAEEMMAFTKNNILQQAATAMLAQANMAPQSVLQLLG
ncbi:MAG: flagellin [Limnochordia bacterium]